FRGEGVGGIAAIEADNGNAAVRALALLDCHILRQRNLPTRLVLVGSQMTGTLVVGLAARRRKTNGGADGDPARALARDIVPENHVDREDVIGPVAHPGLETRPHNARRIALSRLPEHFDGPL